MIITVERLHRYTGRINTGGKILQLHTTRGDRFPITSNCLRDEKISYLIQYYIYLTSVNDRHLNKSDRCTFILLKPITLCILIKVVGESNCIEYAKLMLFSEICGFLSYFSQSLIHIFVRSFVRFLSFRSFYICSPVVRASLSLVCQFFLSHNSKIHFGKSNYHQTNRQFPF